MRRTKNLSRQLNETFDWLEENLHQVNRKHEKIERLTEDLDDLRYDRETRLVEAAMLINLIYPRLLEAPDATNQT